MDLKDLLISQIESLGKIRFTNSFGFLCIYRNRNLFGGIQEVDNNILLLFLILSPIGFKKSLGEGFEKFDFGKTWVQIEIVGEDDLPKVFEYIKEAFDYSRERERIKGLKIKKA